jgi:hypothetical protein
MTAEPYGCKEQRNESRAGFQRGRRRSPLPSPWPRRKGRGRLLESSLVWYHRSISQLGPELSNTRRLRLKYKYLIRDWDSIFTKEVDEVAKAMGSEVKKTPVRAPQASAYCERLIGTSCAVPTFPALTVPPPRTLHHVTSSQFAGNLRSGRNYCAPHLMSLRFRLVRSFWVIPLDGSAGGARMGIALPGFGEKQ